VVITKKISLLKGDQISRLAGLKTCRNITSRITMRPQSSL